MNITFIKQNNKERLVLILAGWGMDANPFLRLESPGYDIAVVWDYTEENLDISLLSHYREIAVIAWSMGVMECARIIPALQLPVTLTIGVNGTATPVSDTDGIPVDIFSGTLNALSDITLTRFNRRMCGSGDAFRSFCEHAPQRPIESLRKELQLLGQRADESNAHSTMRWDIAIIGSRDMIFPATNQTNAWKGTTTIITDEPHLPDFQAIINRFVINKERVATRFDNTRDSYDLTARLQHDVARQLAYELLSATGDQCHFNRAIEIGAGSGQLTKLYQPYLNINDLELWDLSAMYVGNIPPGARMIADDAEARLFEIPDNSIDLIISASTIQWFNSPVNALHQILRILKPGGTAAITLYTTGTYKSLEQATGVSINYVSPERIKQAVSNRCNIIYFETDIQVETFDSTRQLIDHMRLTGVNAAGSTSTSTLRRILKDNTLRQLEYNSTTIIFKKR